MTDISPLISLVIGVLQGVFEWLPISSEGNITLFLTAFTSLEPDAAVQLSLFLHAGTALSATVYYREEVLEVLDDVKDTSNWRPSSAFEPRNAEAWFLGVATFASVVTGLAAYSAIIEMATEVTGGVFVAVIGLLLVITGVLQRVAESRGSYGSRDPNLTDSLLVGGLQGLAILPGVSRSGTTASALLLRGHDGSTSLRLSFLMSIPAAFGAGVLTVLETGGLPSVSPVSAVIAVSASAVVGYLTIDALMRVVERIAFWLVCVVLGLLAVVGGYLTLVL
ncbi:undecaprenyl-diphosphate phosphatase [Halorutilales archaeon Cl-col2-1]